MSSFFITLPSNSSMNYYPNNTLSNYVTKLPRAIELVNQYECGLYECHYPITYYNVTDDETMLHLYSFLGGEQKVFDISPAGGHYKSPHVLVKQINDAISYIEPKPNVVRFLYNDVTQKITVRFGNDTRGWCSLVMSKAMAELLGFEWEAKELAPEKPLEEILRDRPDNIIEKLALEPDGSVVLLPASAYSYTATRVCDLRRGFYSLFIYCSIVEHSIVGDSMVPLLRTVNVEGKEGTMAHRVYQNVQYVPVMLKHFDTIEIDIKDDTGRSVPFQRGRVIVVLHFRPKQPVYF
jgi:hypothetical protein